MTLFCAHRDFNMNPFVSILMPIARLPSCNARLTWLAQQNESPVPGGPPPSSANSPGRSPAPAPCSWPAGPTPRPCPPHGPPAAPPAASYTPAWRVTRAWETASTYVHVHTHTHTHTHTHGGKCSCVTACWHPSILTHSWWQGHTQRDTWTQTLRGRVTSSPQRLGPFELQLQGHLVHLHLLLLPCSDEFSLMVPLLHFHFPLR